MQILSPGLALFQGAPAAVDHFVEPGLNHGNKLLACDSFVDLDGQALLVDQNVAHAELDCVGIVLGFG